MTNIVRAFALTLVLAGFVAAVHPQQNLQRSVFASSSSSNMPIPVCPPNDPNACHIDKW